MVMPSIPAAPPLAFTCFHARPRLAGQRNCSNRSSEEVPCSSCMNRCAMTRPLGFVATGKALALEPPLTSSALPELRDPPGLSGSLLSVLRPRLTPVAARGSLLTSAPTVAGEPGLQASRSKDVNSPCTTGPFISGAEHGAAPGGACSPTPSTLYGLSVGRLISFDPELPSHRTSRFGSCLGLMFQSPCPSL